MEKQVMCAMDMKGLRELIYKGEKVDVECKEAENNVPKSVYESYSAFANTKGGYIVFGVKEDKKKKLPEERFIMQGIENVSKQLEDFWNTVNSNKVNMNILKDEDVFCVEEDMISLIVIHVPRADYKTRPIHTGENPYNGTFKRNYEGDYHCTKEEVRAMIRDQSAEGVDDMVIEHYTMEDIDAETLRAYRMRFQNENGAHIWNTYDGTWENNVFNFLGKILPKLTTELPKPFKLEGYTRVDDTPLHKAVREVCVNMIIHADYMLEGTLKVIKTEGGFEITNLGVLKIPEEQIFQGGNSKARNPRIQTMLRMVGYGDNAGSGFPTILNAWEMQGWETPKLLEDTILNQVTLILKMEQKKAAKKKWRKKTAKKSDEKNLRKSRSNTKFYAVGYVVQSIRF